MIKIKISLGWNMPLKGSSPYGNDLSIFNFTNCESPIQKHIIFDTIYRYKGLENDIIILINLSKISFDLNLLYTGLSRARLILTIVDDTSTIKQLKKIIKSSSSN